MVPHPQRLLSLTWSLAVLLKVVPLFLQVNSFWVVEYVTGLANPVIMSPGTGVPSLQ